MSDTTSTDELLSSIDTKLDALIALTAFGLMNSDSLPDPAFPSLDLLLSETGMSNADIGKVLGKSTGAARKQIERDRKRS